MPGAVWYGAICLASVCVLAYTFSQVRDRRLIALYLMMAGFTYTFEYVVLVLLRGYRYEPGILPDPFLDGVIGAISSNAFVIPAAAVVVAAFQLSWPWIIVMAGLVSGIEIGFLYLGIFAHYWWRTPFTAVGAAAWCFVAKYAYRRLRTRLTTGFRLVALGYAGSLLYATSAFVVFAVLGLYRYRLGLFQDAGRDAMSVSGGSSFLLSLVFAWLVVFRVRWLWRAAILLALMGVDWFLLRSGLLIITGSWSLIDLTLHRLLIIGMLEALNRFALDGYENRYRRRAPGE